MLGCPSSELEKVTKVSPETNAQIDLRGHGPGAVDEKGQFQAGVEGDGERHLELLGKTAAIPATGSLGSLQEASHRPQVSARCGSSQEEVASDPYLHPVQIAGVQGKQPLYDVNSVALVRFQIEELTALEHSTHPDMIAQPSRGCRISQATDIAVETGALTCRFEMAEDLSLTGPWWREAVFYQIYPLSFQDTNNDGLGDLRGVISRLDYLAGTLGVDALWLSPFYRSPMRDWGYDVSDHSDVGPVFGTLADARELVDAAHSRGLRVIVDYVLNHTSEEHPWFVESRSSRDNPKRDWYVWRDGRDGGPPNNWVSVFSGPAWDYNENTEQWYRHTYLPEQPDLNWRNPELVEAMLDVARFWLDMGVDGFRVDAAHQMMKDPLERDNPLAPPDYPRPWKDMGPYDDFIHLYDYGHPDAHEAHRMLRSVIDSYDRDAVAVGEIHIFDLAEWASYYGEALDQLHMPFNFHLMASEWDAASLRATVESTLWNVPVGGWTNWTLGNHDEIRLATRLPYGQERLAALLVLTLRGTPFLYYGDELGMEEAVIPEGQARDPWGLNVAHLSRDGARTPMQWTGGPNAGFSSPGVTPWLPVGNDHRSVNIATELADHGSILNMYRRLLAIRRQIPAIRTGSFTSSPASTDDVYVYIREETGSGATVALNFATGARSVDVDQGTVVFSTNDPDRADEVAGHVSLEPHEGVIVLHS